MASSSCDKKLVRSKSGLRIVALNETLASPFTVTEPPWIPDTECLECMSCRTKFAMFCRRHHCRRCGRCFCGNCCVQQVPLPRMCFVDPVRQCNTCIDVSRKENEFFEKHIKTLLSGGDYHVCSSLTGTENVELVPVYHCKLSTDHRFINFECVNNNLDHEPIELTSITTAQVLTSGSHTPGNTVAIGMLLKYSDLAGEPQSLKLMTVESAGVVQQGAKRQAMAWLASLHRAMKILHENKFSSST